MLLIYSIFTKLARFLQRRKYNRISGFHLEGNYNDQHSKHQNHLNFCKHRLRFHYHRHERRPSRCTISRNCCLIKFLSTTTQLKEFNMTKATNNQVVSLFAALVCAFITIGMSVAPAVAPLAALVA
jgi:hypothetical protein